MSTNTKKSVSQTRFNHMDSNDYYRTQSLLNLSIEDNERLEVAKKEIRSKLGLKKIIIKDGLYRKSHDSWGKPIKKKIPYSTTDRFDTIRQIRSVSEIASPIGFASNTVGGGFFGKSGSIKYFIL